MDLANASPKQMRALAAEIAANDDDRLADFVDSLKARLVTCPLDNGAFRDEIFVLGVNLSKSAVLQSAGASRIASALSGVSPTVVEVFLEGVEKDLAERVRAEIQNSRQAARKAARSTGRATGHFPDKFKAARQVRQRKLRFAGIVSQASSVVVHRVDPTRVSMGVKVIRGTVEERPAEGEIVAVSSVTSSKKGRIAALDVKVGDRVRYGKSSGTVVKVGGEDLLIVKDSDVRGNIG